MASDPKALSARDLSDALLHASLIVAEAQRLEAIVAGSVLDIPKAVAALRTMDRGALMFPMVWATLLDGLNALQTLRDAGPIEHVSDEPAPPVPSVPRLVKAGPPTAFYEPPSHIPFVCDRFRQAPGKFLPGATPSSVATFSFGAGVWRGFVDLDGETIPWTSIEVWSPEQGDIDVFWEELTKARMRRCIVVAEGFHDGLKVPDGMILVTIRQAYPAGPSVA